MKKVFYLIIFTLALVLSSCTKDMGGNYGQTLQDNYETAFVSAFGQPSDTQDWGFGPLILPASTRAAQPNGNQWGTTDDNSKYIDWPQPAPITDDELAKVLAVFNEKGKTNYEPLVHWSNFFVQQVYTGPNGSKMNELATTVTYKKNVNVISWWPYEESVTIENVAPFDDIINNFNAGDCTAWDGCMLMWDAATDDFSFKTSQGGGQRWYKHWRMEEIDGNYYVGFDHESAKQGSDANENELDVRDYVYNDWIVKIVPGRGNDHVTYKARIICEDLSVEQATDFDFNDAVFDVEYKEGDPKMTITVRAAGGTIPLYIDGKEIHQLFAEANPDAGVIIPTETVKGSMINTGADLNGLRAPVFMIDPKNPADIAITVNKNGAIIPLNAETGKPASKIAVDPSFVWCQERKAILDVYPAFANYVKNGTIDWF